MRSPHQKPCYSAPSLRVNYARRSLHLIIIVVFYLFIIAPRSIKGVDLQQYYEQNQNVTFHDKKEFLQNFPFDNYLQSVKFTDFATLQSARKYLWTKFGDGDEFLYYLAEQFLKNYQITNNLNDLRQKIDIGELYLNPKKDFGGQINETYRPQINEIYTIIGYFILGKVADKISREIAAGNFDENEPERAKCIQRLNNNRTYISREESGGSKIIANIKSHNWRYLLHRAMSYIYDYKKAIRYASIPLIFLGIVLIWLGMRFKHGFLKFLFKLSGGAGILITLAVLAISFTNPLSAQTTKTIVLSCLKQTPHSKHHAINNGANYAVEIYKLFCSNTEIGQAIWLDRESSRASYIAFNNVPARYGTYTSQHQVTLATSGGYTNAAHQPEGLTIEDGNIVNAVLMPDRHGLAMVSQGGINILNLKENEFTLPSGQKIQNPLDSLLAYAQLLQWCQNNHATIFQTHLLAYSDKLLIDPLKAKQEPRERRILALARDKNNQRLYHIIFNVTTQYKLAEISTEILGLLQGRNMKVEAILNLDVGAFNILYIYDEQGNPLTDVKGPVDISTATNLLVYEK